MWGTKWGTNWGTRRYKSNYIETFVSILDNSQVMWCKRGMGTRGLDARFQFLNFIESETLFSLLIIILISSKKVLKWS